MAKLTEVFKIKEGDVIPFKKGGTKPPEGPPDPLAAHAPKKGEFSKVVQKLKSGRAGGLLNMKTVKALEQIADELNSIVDRSTTDGDNLYFSWDEFVQNLEAVGSSL